MPVMAGRLSFDLIKPDGERLRGGEVCFFAGGRGSSPFEQLLWSGETRCFPADQIVAVPRGQWNYFIRHEAGWVSAHPLAVVIGGGPETTDTGYKGVAVHVRRASVADVSGLVSTLGAGEHAVLYFPGIPGMAAHVMPVVAGTKRMLVAAGLEFVPLVAARGTVVAIGELQSIPDEPEVHAIPAIRSGRGRAAISYVILPKDIDSPSSPTITVAFGPEVHNAVTPAVALTQNDFVIFTGLPVATGKLEVAGPFWEHIEESFDAATGTGVLLFPPIRLRPAGTILVDLPSDERATSWYRSLADVDGCHAAEVGKATLRVDVLRCAALGDCAESASKAIPLKETPGELRFEGLPPGSYQVRVRRDTKVVFEDAVTVVAGEPARVAATFHFTMVSGTVRRGNETVRAHLRLPGGSATTDDSGRFTAHLATFGEGDSITVHPCGQSCSFTVRVDPKQATTASVDIELPRNDLRLRVVERVSGKAIEHAATRIMRVGGDGNVELNVPGPLTDSDGLATICTVPLDRSFLLCADAKGYQSSCAPVADGTEIRDVARLELAKMTTLEGRLHTPKPIENGALFFVTALTGGVTENVRVQADGAFVMQQPHGPDEVAILVARNFPLTVIRISPSHESALELTVPAGRERTVDVRLASAGRAALGLAIGTVTVPSSIFTLNQAVHGQQATATYDKATKITVLETEPIFIIRGLDASIDPRHAAALPRVEVGPGDTVIALP